MLVTDVGDFVTNTIVAVISSAMKVEVNKKVLAQFLNLEFFSLRQNA